jgi:hypothetical protein
MNRPAAVDVIRAILLGPGHLDDGIAVGGTALAAPAPQGIASGFGQREPLSASPGAESATAACS